jgi:hypothetical protein
MGSKFTVPGMTQDQARKVADLLQKQLSNYNDLHLTSSTCTGMCWAPTLSVCTR